MNNPKDDKEQEESQDKWIEWNEKIKELEPKFNNAKDSCITLVKKIYVPELVKEDGIRFKDFDPVRYKIVKDHYDKGYALIHNWVLIGSLGDPSTWDGMTAIVKKGSKDGLAGTLIDMNVMQEILY